MTNLLVRLVVFMKAFFETVNLKKSWQLTRNYIWGNQGDEVVRFNWNKIEWRPADCWFGLTIKEHSDISLPLQDTLTFDLVKFWHFYNLNIQTNSWFYLSSFFTALKYLIYIELFFILFNWTPFDTNQKTSMLQTKPMCSEWLWQKKQVLVSWLRRTL